MISGASMSIGAASGAWKVMAFSLEKFILIQSFMLMLRLMNMSRYGSLSLNQVESSLVNLPSLRFRKVNSGNFASSRFSTSLTVERGKVLKTITNAAKSTITTGM